MYKLEAQTAVSGLKLPIKFLVCCTDAHLDEFDVTSLACKLYDPVHSIKEYSPLKMIVSSLLCHFASRYWRQEHLPKKILLTFTSINIKKTTIMCTILCFTSTCSLHLQKELTIVLFLNLLEKINYNFHFTSLSAFPISRSISTYMDG